MSNASLIAKLAAVWLAFVCWISWVGTIPSSVESRPVLHGVKAFFNLLPRDAY